MILGLWTTFWTKQRGLYPYCKIFWTKPKCLSCSQGRPPTPASANKKFKVCSLILKRHDLREKLHWFLAFEWTYWGVLLIWNLSRARERRTSWARKIELRALWRPGKSGPVFRRSETERPSLGGAPTMTPAIFSTFFEYLCYFCSLFSIYNICNLFLYK